MKKLFEIFLLGDGFRCAIFRIYEKENIPYRAIVRVEWSGADSLQPELGYYYSSGEHQCSGHSALHKSLRHTARITLATVSNTSRTGVSSGLFYVPERRGRPSLSSCDGPLVFFREVLLGFCKKPVNVSP